MKGWLIYDKAGAARNEWFIRRLIEKGEKYGLRLQPKIVENGEIPCAEGEILPRFAIVRTICPDLNAKLEKLGVRTVNNAETARIANDKWETYQACKAWGIPVLKTKKLDLCKLPESGYPFVAKSRDGHGGQEVFWLDSGEDIKKLPADAAQKQWIAQTPCGILGKDMRAYVVGGEIVACILRESETDFRSNFSLGGRVKAVAPTKEQRELVAKLWKNLRSDFIGVDFLPTGNGWVLNEIEDSAGSRMLYQCTDLDIADIFIRYLREKFE